MDTQELRSNDYHFITHWRVQGDINEVAAILSDAPGLVRWWPSVYLDVNQLDPGDERGVGKVVDLHTKGWLPYTLSWRFRVTEANHPHGFTIVASGDFEGLGVWTLEQDGSWANVTYDWKIRAEKPILRYGSFVMKPIFAANHRWAMARGEESLQLELARREAKSEAALACIPSPPAPTTFRPLGRVAIAVLVVMLLALGAAAKTRVRRQNRDCGRGSVRL